ncbi:1,2-phenylacetyl-CoA epoxidase subunit PaaD [Kordiimonas pumila]|uniref:1,2-phenylacetyl-CoA epoxidase subunit PaaD n=1 Tax=Kordiimonas pumila TaxID=2161677 RepID=A0ABV7CZN8_9PROT
MLRPQEKPCSEEESFLWAILADVMDPEVPALSVVDLGVVRAVHVTRGRTDGANGAATIDVSPTYSGCPATALINEIIRAAAVNAGFIETNIKTVISPPWTSDWISDEGREKLRAYGIAPPVKGAKSGKGTLFGLSPAIACPKCGSKNTENISEFGSTACKAMYRCCDCLEPFEYFKCI